MPVCSAMNVCSMRIFWAPERSYCVLLLVGVSCEVGHSRIQFTSVVSLLKLMLLEPVCGWHSFVVELDQDKGILITAVGLSKSSKAGSGRLHRLSHESSRRRLWTSTSRCGSSEIWNRGGTLCGIQRGQGGQVDQNSARRAQRMDEQYTGVTAPSIRSEDLARVWICDSFRSS
jgi:hypothetical protein